MQNACSFSLSNRACVCALAICALTASLAMHTPFSIAQQGQGSPVLTPVEAGEDINPLKVGLRRQRVDLRGPSGFDRLYRVTPGAVIGGVTIKEGGYARISGSTVVVYPRGAYSQVAPGVVRADAPAGTMYLQVSDVSSLIGSPQERAAQSMNGSQSQVSANQRAAQAALTGTALRSGTTGAPLPRALNARIDPSSPESNVSIDGHGTQADPGQVTVTSTASTELPSLWGDERYRQRRIGAMIDAAASGRGGK
jgi:hypothetical protein